MNKSIHLELWRHESSTASELWASPGTSPLSSAPARARARATLVYSSLVYSSLV